MFEVLKIIFKRIKLKTLIILILLLMFNTYAWFIYSTKVSTSFTTHIIAWNVQFKAGETDLSSSVTFNVDRAYPGMDDYSQKIAVTNNGEMDISLSYTIKSVTILGETYTADETTTSDDLLNMIKNNYPFSINIVQDADTLNANGGTGSFVITFTWPYESDIINNTVEGDMLDTDWGEKAYEYYAVNPNTPSIQLDIELTANQLSG